MKYSRQPEFIKYKAETGECCVGTQPDALKPASPQSSHMETMIPAVSEMGGLRPKFIASGM